MNSSQKWLLLSIFVASTKKRFFMPRTDGWIFFPDAVFEAHLFLLENSNLCGAPRDVPRLFHAILYTWMQPVRKGLTAYHNRQGAHGGWRMNQASMQAVQLPRTTASASGKHRVSGKNIPERRNLLQ